VVERRNMMEGMGWRWGWREGRWWEVRDNMPGGCVGDRRWWELRGSLPRKGGRLEVRESTPGGGICREGG